MGTGRLADYWGSGDLAVRPDAATLAADLYTEVLAVYYARDTEELYVLNPTVPEWVLYSGGDSFPPLTGNGGKVLAVNSGATGVQWVPQSGGGGGGGNPEAPWTVPLLADFTTQNLGLFNVVDSPLGIVFKTIAGNSFALRGIQQPVGPPPWDIYCKVDLGFWGGEGNGRVGILVRNEATGRITTFGFFNINESSKRVSKIQWNSYASYQSGNELYYYQEPKPWLRLENDGTNLKQYIGNGYEWQVVQSVSLATFMGSVDQIGFGVQSGQDTLITINSFSLTPPA